MFARVIRWLKKIFCMDEKTLYEQMSKKVTDNHKLYRIMPLEQLMNMLEDSTNTLVRPSKWEDPYEELMMISKIQSDDSQGRDIKTLDWKRWYGQCWSYVNESDSLWRAFTNGKNVRCVKITTTYSKLKKSLASSPTQDKRRVIPFLEDVSYINDYLDEFDATYRKYAKIFIGSLTLPDNLKDANEAEYYINNSFVFSLLQTKRKAFVHENEIRLLAFEEGEVENYDKDSVYKYEVTPTELIDNVEFDPWTPPYLKNSYLKLMEKYGLKNENGKEVVSFSELYKKPSKGLTIRISAPQITNNTASI